MRFFAIAPEAAGDLGKSCKHGDLKERPVKIYESDFEFQFWPHDDLLDGFYTYACTDELATALGQTSFTGFKIDDLKVSFEERFHQWAEMHKDEKLPEFKWLKITGRAGIDDFGELPGPVAKSLVVSERALHLLKKFKLGHCGIETYTGKPLSAAG